ncbi:hypothetical protein SAMD00019534_009810 [Acytostelium subglobosum LB1]|uniref:hypothetical protein n=1 Tax=Acytostelium subglobosum LB1 TaxID=1410327 RepID=UPI000644A651|nr:hypothetical protein SAMD00019534_009810 [Acytostelium subglobosum LB1]GAM17806.1 hypothetical protein SAMD00019534_009810 [Acytostelium subglobosum LB1]|eukprot:XP_012758402.1 hypothetical protein SAMD00019534_009810 [Acytostelium subglobosum LB1]
MSGVDYLDDLLEEMIVDHKQRHPESSPSNSFLNQSATTTSTATAMANANALANANVESNANANGNASPSRNNQSPKMSRANNNRMSKISSDHFDYLETLLSDMSANDLSLPSTEAQTDQQVQDSRIKLLRLTSTFDLESTLMDLESFYWKYSQQGKRVPSMAPPGGAAAPPPLAGNRLSTMQQTSAQQQQEVPLSSSPTQRGLSSSQQRRSSSDRTALTKEAISAADTLDQMISSFGNELMMDTSSSATTESPKRSGIPHITSGTATVRPASKLNAPVDIAMASPKAPTPIPTLSEYPLSPSAVRTADNLLDEMITSFKESNQGLKFVEQPKDRPKQPYLSQQHYTLSHDDMRHLQHLQKQQQADDDLIDKILCDSDIEENYRPSGGSGANGGNSMAASINDKPWHIEQEINNKEVIGYGNHGMTARAGIHKEKRIVGKSWTFITPQCTPLLFTEIETLISIKHPNVLPLIGASMTTTFNTFSEYVTGNSLDIVLKNVDERTEISFIIRVAEEISSAMAFLHSFNIVHRSLHSKNVVLNSDLKVFIKDYGLAGLKDETIRKKLMNPINNTMLHSHYMAPELFHVLAGGKGGYDTKVDVFSFGVLLWEMFARNTKLSELKSSINNGYTSYVRPSLPNCPFAIDKLIRLCLSSDPAARPSFQTILKVLRQPLHTLQRFQKPESPGAVSPKLSDTPSSTQVGSSGASGLDSEKRDKIQKIIILCRDLQSSPTLSNLTRASSALEALCKSEGNLPYLYEHSVFSLVFQLLATKFEDVQLSALRSIGSLINDRVLCSQFRNVMGVNTILHMTQEKSENIQFATIRVLQTLCHREENIQEIVAKGGVPIMIRQLSSQNELIRLQIVWCLTMLLDSAEAQDEFIKMGGADMLVDMFVQSKNDGFDLRVASSLSRVLSSKYTQDLINNGPHRERVLEKYISLLDSNIETLKMLGLEAVAMLISNNANQETVVRDNNVVPLLLEYLQQDYVRIAPQMTAIKIILVLASNPAHTAYLASYDLRQSLTTLVSSSPHPSIQKASEKIVHLLSKSSK